MIVERSQDTYSVWVDYENRNEYKESQEYKEILAECKALGCSLCIFVGGEMPLVPAMDDLIQRNTVA